MLNRREVIRAGAGASAAVLLGGASAFAKASKASDPMEGEAYFVGPGGMFKVEMVHRIAPVMVPTTFDAACRYWGRAGSTGVLMAKRGLDVYVLDVDRDQLSPFEFETHVEDVARADDAMFGLLIDIVVEQEPGSGGAIQAEYTKRRLQGSRVHSELATMSKEQRAHPWAIAMESGEVFVVEADWTQGWIDEHAAFPAGSHYGQVRSSSGAYHRLVKENVENLA